jgi:hypothetical protein
VRHSVVAFKAGDTRRLSPTAPIALYRTYIELMKSSGDTAPIVLYRTYIELVKSSGDTAPIALYRTYVELMKSSGDVQVSTAM